MRSFEEEIEQALKETENHPDLQKAIRQSATKRRTEGTVDSRKIGSFYWIPLPDQTDGCIWEPYVPNEDLCHSIVWKAFVLPLLKAEWGKDTDQLAGYFKGLPRGRSGFRANERIRVWHGNDGPAPLARHMKRALQALNLSTDITLIQAHHEMMNEEHARTVEATLGITFYDDFKRDCTDEEPPGQL